MTTQTSESLLPQTKSNSLLNLWHKLTQPADGVVGDDRRRATSLSALMLVFIPFAMLIVFLTPMMQILNGEEFTGIPNGGVIGLTIMFFAYGISRTKYFQIAAYLTIAVPIIAVGMVTLTTEGTIEETALFYLALSVILSSLLLSSRDTIATGLLVAFIIILFPILNPGVLVDVPVNILTYIATSTGVMALISRIREQNLEKLELIQSQLEEQIKTSEEARERAERSDQVKSAFLASMSHELRTPLNAIINFTRFVSKGTLGPVNEEQVETLDNVIISGKHLLNLINDVLDMAKIESGSLNLFVSDDVNLNDIITEVGMTGRALLNEKPVELKTEIEEELPQIRGDHQRIRQILLNIVSNACKFTNEGAITIAAKQEADDIIVSVVDTGCGIAKENQTMVFEAFKQTTDGLRQGGGTGLGMPITKNLIEAHNGVLSLESEVGKGSTFHIRLPIKSDTLSPTLITEI